MKRYFVEIDGQWRWIWAEKVGPQLWFHLEGQTFAVDWNSKKKSLRDTATEMIETGEIKAPMPGQVIKVLKNEKDRVQKGETVLVLEAMKMEYSLEADTQGVIEKLNVGENQQVNLGQLLAVINKEAYD